MLICTRVVTGGWEITVKPKAAFGEAGTAVGLGWPIQDNENI